MTAIADVEIKSKARRMWALGDYGRVAREIIPSLGPELVEAAGVREGERVLDVAAGTGNAAIPAAGRGAQVVASDLTPELLEVGRAGAADLAISWEEGDAERLPYADASFDRVLSCLGVMFAPRHQDSADELVRVVRPGGGIGLLSWTPAGFIGQMFAAMKPFAPAPPPGAQPPPLWGDPGHVTALLGDRVVDVRAEARALVVDRFRGPSAFREYFAAHYGPTIAVYGSLGGDEARIAALDSALDEVAARFTRVDAGGRWAMEWEYLLLTATRR